MKEFELKGTKVDKVEFVNTLPSNTKIMLSNKYSYNVGYSKNNTCTGEFRAEIFDKNSPERFKIVVTIKGFFQILQNVSKEILHVKTYDALFPHVKAFICSLTANCFIPPIYIPYVDISQQNIYTVEMPRKIDDLRDEE